ncbi:hypothetical protein F4819DRAFT_501297 [Hypoxylon fuscum]|nr:hypothetical protein F4819DRAFT_501297 [Hypoxylon fuscum]
MQPNIYQPTASSIHQDSSIPDYGYQGNLRLSRSRCASIPQSENCRLWITGLPPSCDYHTLLTAVQDAGPVYATHITGPVIHSNPQNAYKNIYTAAVSLTFFDERGTNRFLAQNAVTPFTVAGYTTKVIHHRIRTKPVAIDGRSRVLQITGSPDIINPDTLQALFQRFTAYFDIDYANYEEGVDDTNTVEVAFGSFRAQAQPIFMGLRHTPGIWVVKYVPDPCQAQN